MNRIITTTTDTLEGWEINEYFPPVSSNVVVGTNIFSDISASLTDFFGGRSGTYEKKLQQLYSQAISAIESKAKAVSANAIVGLKIDIDEVSGKNSQMFMITAYGTPVKVTRLKANAPESEWSHKSVIDGTYIGQKVIAKRIIEHAAKNGDLTRKEVAFIAENPFPEFVDTALLILKAKSETISADENDPDKKTLEKLGIYFSAIDSSLSVPALYGELLNSNNSPKVLHSLQTILSTSFLIDYTEIIRLLDSDSEACRKIALNLVLLDKPYYEPEDANKLKIISEKIQQVFKPLSLITKKKMFLGGEKDVWECRCGQTNVVADWEYCQKCGNDIYGFKENEPKPDDVALLVADRLIFLDDGQKPIN